MQGANELVKNQEIKAVLFDMDGVLIDAKEWHYEALNKTLELFGHKIRRSDHLETFDGLPTRTKLRMLTKERDLPEELHDFINEIKQQYTLDYAWNLCKPQFHHELALSELKSAGLKIACCSNSVRSSMEMMLSKAALLPWIDLVVSNEDVDRPKPHPDMYTKAHKHFGLRADECLVVEDNQHGIEAAQAAGCHLMVVADVNEVTLENIQSRIQSI